MRWTTEAEMILLYTLACHRPEDGGYAIAAENLGGQEYTKNAVRQKFAKMKKELGSLIEHKKEVARATSGNGKGKEKKRKSTLTSTSNDSRPDVSADLSSMSTPTQSAPIVEQLKQQQQQQSVASASVMTGRKRDRTSPTNGGNMEGPGNDNANGSNSQLGIVPKRIKREEDQEASQPLETLVSRSNVLQPDGHESDDDYSSDDDRGDDEDVDDRVATKLSIYSALLKENSSPQAALNPP